MTNYKGIDMRLCDVPMSGSFGIEPITSDYINNDRRAYFDESLTLFAILRDTFLCIDRAFPTREGMKRSCSFIKVNSELCTLLWVVETAFGTGVLLWIW